MQLFLKFAAWGVGAMAWFSVHAHAVPLASFTAVDAGAYVDNLEARFGVPEVFRSTVSRVTAVARIRRGLYLGRRLFFEPSFAMVLPWSSGVDGTALNFTFHSGLELSYQPFSFFRLKLGPGIRWNLFIPKSETVELDNGEGTADFYIPSRPMNTFLFTADIGLEFWLSPRFFIEVSAMTSSLFHSARRSTHAALTVGVRL